MRGDYTITRHEGQAPSGLVLSPNVRHLLTPPVAHVVWWLALHSSDSTAIALYNKMGYTVAARAGTPITFPGGDGHRCQVMFKRLHAADA